MNRFSSNEDTKVEEDRLLQYVQPMDIKNFGLIPELLGRFPVITHLNPLDRNALTRILTEPQNAIIKQYTKLFAMDDIQLNMDKEVIDFIVDKAMEYKLGARGLRSICEAILLDGMFDLPTKKKKTFHVDVQYAKSKFENSNIARLKVA